MTDSKNKDELEALAYVEYGRFLLSCLIVRRLFDAAGLPYPAPLQRMGNDLPKDTETGGGK